MDVLPSITVSRDKAVPRVHILGVQVGDRDAGACAECLGKASAEIRGIQDRQKHASSHAPDHTLAQAPG